MRPATLAEREQMEKDVEAVEEQFKRGLALVGAASLVNADTLLLLAAPLLVGAGVRDDNTRRVLAGMETARKDIVTWRTRWKKWAEDGRQEDGDPYDVPTWQALGVSIARDIQFWTGMAVDRTAFVAVGQAVQDTATTLREWKEMLPAADELRWLKWTAVAVGGALVLGSTAYLVRSFRR